MYCFEKILELLAYFSKLLIPVFSVFFCDCLYSQHVNGVTRIDTAWFHPEPTQCLHGQHRMMPSPRTNTHDHGCFELYKTSVFSSRYPNDLRGRSHTTNITNLHGTYIAATLLIHRIMRHFIRVEPATIWKWDLRNKATIAENYSWLKLSCFLCYNPSFIS